MSVSGEIYSADKNITLPAAVTAVTNLTSDQTMCRGANEVKLLINTPFLFYSVFLFLALLNTGEGRIFTVQWFLRK